MLTPYKDGSPAQRFPLITLLLIISNTLAFLYQTFGEIGFENAVYELGVVPIEVIKGENLSNSTLINPYISIFTSIFIHESFLHLSFNLLYLWIFGNNIEYRMKYFILFYILAGFISVIAFIISAPFNSNPLVGASGAVSGILGAYLFIFPFSKVHVLIFFFVIRMPAIIFLCFWFLFQIFNLLGDDMIGGGIAWICHISGFIAGIR